MSVKPNRDDRSPERRALDEQIAAEPRLETPELTAHATAGPMESLLTRRRRHPIAVEGVVENGVVRLSILR